MSKLIIMVGAPGSGKTSWVEHELNKISDEHSNTSSIAAHISRDTIRFSKVSEEEKYFSKEDSVFKEFVSQIKCALAANVENVYADATHDTCASRAKLLRALGSYPDVDVIFKVMDTGISNCLENNEKRKNTRAYVPKSVIKRFKITEELPRLEEFKQFENKFKSFTIV